MSSPLVAPKFRRTRFVCISDTHNFTPKLPKGDVLIHAGDLTNQGTFTELSKAVQWLEKADFEAKIVIAGNHDITLDRDFYAEHGTSFHNQNPESPEACMALLTNSPTITYLNHASTTIRLSSPSGPHTTFSIFGSPYSPRQHDGRNWAFQYPEFSSSSNLSASQPPDALWSAIPLSSDIVITHTPPSHHLGEDTGCEALRRAPWRVRPRLHVCGHVHGARGSERVKWDLEASHGAFKEAGVEVWEDPSGPNSGDGNGAGKMALVDLTGRKGHMLDNDGGVHEKDGDWHNRASHEGTHGGSPHGVTEDQGGFDDDLSHSFDRDGPHPDPGPTNAVTSGLGTAELGGGPVNRARSDVEALGGRLGRRETCIANCAIVATSYPHVGGRRFNKPIVVDLDLPVWE